MRLLVDYCRQPQSVPTVAESHSIGPQRFSFVRRLPDRDELKPIAAAEGRRWPKLQGGAAECGDAGRREALWGFDGGGGTGRGDCDE